MIRIRFDTKPANRWYNSRGYRSAQAERDFYNEQLGIPYENPTPQFHDISHVRAPADRLVINMNRQQLEDVQAWANDGGVIG